MFDQYKGKIVHVFGGLYNYLGEIETFPCEEIDKIYREQGKTPMFKQRHPNGPGWIRLKNPVMTTETTVQYEKNKYRKNVVLEKLGGYEGNYEPFVDINLPVDESLVEIRVVAEDSPLHAYYLKEISHERPKHIVTPGMADIQRVQAIKKQ